jgi:hypothetical protein
MYNPYRHPRRDLIFPRGAGGNFIMAMLNLDKKIYNSNNSNEYFFYHSYAYHNSANLERFKKIILKYFDEIIDICTKAEKFKHTHSRMWIYNELLRNITAIKENSFNDAQKLDYTVYPKIVNHLLPVSAELSVLFHNDILSAHTISTDRFITCAEHIPAPYYYRFAKPYDFDFFKYLKNEMNYEYAFVDITDAESFDYINTLRMYKHSCFDTFNPDTRYETEITQFNRGVKIFNWRQLFKNIDIDTWEELFDYYDKHSIWKIYNKKIIEHIKKYVNINDDIVKNNQHLLDKLR